jgi:hypothetical protein
LSETADKSLKSGEDGFCLPKEYNGPTHSIESLRCLTIAYLYLFEWLLWDVHIVAHGSYVANVLGVLLSDNADVPLIGFGMLSSAIVEYHPLLNDDRRVLSLVHPSLVNRGLGVVRLV